MSAERRRGGVLLGALALAIAIAAGIGAVQGSGKAEVAIDSGPARVRVPGVATTGSVAPSFDLAALNGGPRVSLAAYRDKPVIVNFFASWCTPCRKEFPVLRDLHRARPDLVIIGITYKDLAFDARRFARDQRADWTLAEGGDGDHVGRSYGVRAIPQTFFIDRRGVIRARAFGLPSSAAIADVVARISG